VHALCAHKPTLNQVFNIKPFLRGKVFEGSVFVFSVRVPAAGCETGWVATQDEVRVEGFEEGENWGREVGARVDYPSDCLGKGGGTRGGEDTGSEDS
jgi:hypothetical protein